MARRDDLANSVARYLRTSEHVLAGARATRRNGVLWTSLLGGGGAAMGYLVSTFVSEGILAAAIGGGAGAAVGVVISSILSSFVMRRSHGIRAAVVLMVLTDKRLLMFGQSWLNNRAVSLAREIDLGSITSIVVGDLRLFTAHPVTIALTEGTAIELESAKVERPHDLAEAFRRAVGG
ncbi:MAG: hypothetical protein KQH83_10470 [Actinobacteria bacterium]|nr:hypothetical protein [Actinomycetota bacterium]